MIKAVPPSLESIRAKVEAGDRLSFDDGMFLDNPAVPLNEVGARRTWCASGRTATSRTSTSTRI